LSAPRVALADEAPMVRRYAVEALTDIGGEQALELARAAESDGDAEVRQAAEKAAEHIRGDSVSPCQHHQELWRYRAAQATANLPYR
jgi:HEAT repeat protein